MRLWKRALAQLYYASTIGYRRRLANRASAAGRAPIVVPVFHRIADDAANEWTTSTNDFCAAIRWMQDNFEMISIAEAQRWMASPEIQRPGVCLTFDDGYAVNCHAAIPFLLENEVPFTYFVTVAAVLHGECFTHDLQMGNRFAPNSITELRELSRQGVEIGAHTRTHADLGAISDEAQLHDEIVGSRDELQDALGQPVRYLAFPYGGHANLSQAAFRIARDSGYAGVCSSYGGYNYAGDDPFHLQRRGVDGELFRIKNWMFRDPLRHSNTVRYIHSWEGPQSFCKTPRSKHLKGMRDRLTQP